MEINNRESSKTPRLKDDEILNPFLEYLEPACMTIKPGESLMVYRTQDVIPVDEYGEWPRPRRRDGEDAMKQKLSKEEVAALTPKKRDKMMGEWGSHVMIQKNPPFRAFYIRIGNSSKKEPLRKILRILQKNEASISVDIS